MSKTVKIYIILLILLFAGAIAIEFSKPRPIDWRKTFNETQTIPYGTYILFNELPNLFPNSDIQTINLTPYEYFDARYDWDNEVYTTSGTYMYIDEEMTIDQVSAQELLDFASYGNEVFISSYGLPELLEDSLGIETRYGYSFSGKATLHLANSRFKTDSITVSKGLLDVHFAKLDSSKTTVLGYQKFADEEAIDFVKITYGEGHFLIHSQPVLFTNYHLLKENHHTYAAAVLSYLTEDTIHFDSRAKTRENLSSSPLRFILSKPALKWAWILALLSLVVFIVFNAKRKQRVVPIIEPNENTTVAFTKTIGNLYYETKDHDNIIDKKITYFLEHIRRMYYLDTHILDDKFVKNLILKSGRKSDIVKKLINLIAHLKAKPHCNENDLLTLNQAIENFHTNK